MDNLNEHPQIAELMETLDKNGMQKEKTEVQSLVDYIGDMEQGIQKEAMYLGLKKQRIKKEDRFYVSRTHEPVVNRELFDKVQELIEDRKKKYFAGRSVRFFERP